MGSTVNKSWFDKANGEERYAAAAPVLWNITTFERCRVYSKNDYPDGKVLNWFILQTTVGFLMIAWDGDEASLRDQYNEMKRRDEHMMLMIGYWVKVDDGGED